MESVKVQLKSPVEFKGSKIDQLCMRGPKVRDLLGSEKAAKNTSEREVYLFAALCEVAEEVIHEMSLADYGQLQEAYRGFLS